MRSPNPVSVKYHWNEIISTRSLHSYFSKSSKCGMMLYNMWGCYPLVLWNVSKAGPHSLLFLTLSGPVVSSSHLSKEQAPLRMLLASWTVALKENCLTPLHKNSKKERIPGSAGKPRCPWSNSKVLRRCIFTASQKHEILFFKSPDYRLVPFVLPLCFLLDMNLLRSIEIDLLLKFFCANLPLFVGIYV